MILALPIEDRIWPNCLGRPVRNSSPVDMKEFLARMNKAPVMCEGETSERMPSKSVANRTRSKVTTPKSKTSCSVRTLYSDSLDSPRTEEGGLEISSSRTYVRGTRTFYSLTLQFLLFLPLSLVLLSLIEPFYVIVEFKPPVIKPLFMSTKEIFAKRARDEKTVETESSKSPTLFESNLGSDAKKFKASEYPVSMRSDVSIPQVFHDYVPHGNPGEFAHLLPDMLLSQYVDSSLGKTPLTILNEANGYAFHVSSFFFASLFSLHLSSWFLSLACVLCRTFKPLSWLVMLLLSNL